MSGWTMAVDDLVARDSAVARQARRATLLEIAAWHTTRADVDAGVYGPDHTARERWHRQCAAELMRMAEAPDA